MFNNGKHSSKFEPPSRREPSWSRMRENLTLDFEKAAYDFYWQVLKLLKSRTFIFYGHSLGALLAFRVCQLLEHRKISPAYLVVSGNPGPGIPPTKRLHELDDNEFIEELRNLGGIPEEILENPQSLHSARTRSLRARPGWCPRHQSPRSRRAGRLAPARRAVPYRCERRRLFAQLLRSSSFIVN